MQSKILAQKPIYSKNNENIIDLTYQNLEYNGDANINNIVFVDESGMTDSELFSILLNAVDFRRTEVLFAGDLGQVQPVGNGDPFRDILVNKITDNIITLDKVYRQKEEQAINIIAQDIRRDQIS